MNKKSLCQLNRLVIIFFMFLPILQACSWVSQKGVSKEVKNLSLVWPEKPERSRYIFVKSVKGAEDLGINKSIFARIIDVFFGEHESYLVKPMAVIALPDSTLLVADPGVGGIHRFNIKEAEHDVLMREGGGLLLSPVALARDRDRVYVSDSILGVFVIEPNQDSVRPVKLDYPPKRSTGIAFNNHTNQLYISDTLSHKIYVYDTEGKRVQSIGRRGQQEGQFNYPTMLWIDNSEKLYVSDSLNFRIQIFSPKGRFLRAFGKAGNSTGLHARPKGVATDGFGHVYIVDSLFHSVQVFSQQGEFLLNFGQQGSNPGEFWLPTGIFIGGIDGNTIYVADSYNKRLQIFRYVGGEV